MSKARQAVMLLVGGLLLIPTDPLTMGIGAVLILGAFGLEDEAP